MQFADQILVIYRPDFGNLQTRISNLQTKKKKKFFIFHLYFCSMTFFTWLISFLMADRPYFDSLFSILPILNSWKISKIVFQFSNSLNFRLLWKQLCNMFKLCTKVVLHHLLEYLDLISEVKMRIWKFKILQNFTSCMTRYDVIHQNYDVTTLK